MAADLTRARELFLHAVGRLTADQWRNYLAEACGGDDELESHVNRLLQIHREAGSFLERPAIGPITAFEPEAKRTEERPGGVIGPYKLLQQIGEGGMGVVYMAEQTQPVQRKVAVKVIKAGMDTRQVIARFEAERQALAMMDHANIARVLDVGATDTGRPYFVMELVHGVPITRYCDDKHLSPRQRLELFIPVCRAIQHAHQKGIIHRDIKPSNVMVTLYDGKPVPKIIDFGVAKAIEQKLTERTLFTQYGTMVGTFEYMSPEQAEMSALGVDTRSDIYSLGVLLYELLTGSTPLTHQRVKNAAFAEILRLIKEEEPPKPSTRLSESRATREPVSSSRQMEPSALMKLLRGELDWIVMKALEKDRNRRYETSSALAADVQRYLDDEPVQACPPSALYRVRKFVRRNRAAIATASVLAISTLIAVGVVAGSLGWMAHERSVRKGTISREVELALQESESLADRARKLTDNPYQWEATLTAARSALKRADGLVASEKSGLDAPVRERLDALRGRLDADENDRRFVVRFDEILIEQSEMHVPASRHKLEVAFPGFQELFASHYDIVFGATDPEMVGRLVRQRPEAVREYLVAAFEISFAHVPRRETQARRWLADVLRAVDAGPWRQRARAAVEARDWTTLDTLIREGIAARQTPSVLLALAGNIPRDDSRTPDLYREIRDAYAGDFWTNAWLAAVLHYRQEPRLEESLRYYAAAIALRPRNPGSYVDMGNALRSKGDVDEALAAYRRAVEIAPDYPAAHRRIGSLLKSKGDLNGARAAYQKSIDVATDRAQAGYWLGLLRQEVDRDLDGAIAAYRECIRLRPVHWAAFNNLGIALVAQGRDDEAIAAFHDAIRVKPDYVRARTNLADLLVRKGRLEEAIDLRREVVCLEPNNGDARYRLGFDLNSKGRLDEAIAEYREAVRLEPTDFYHQYALADALLRKGLLDDAIATYRETIRLRPSDEEAHYWAAWALNNKGRSDEAIAEYREALRLKPDHTAARNDLAEMLNNQAWILATHPEPAQRDPVRALGMAKEAVELNPHDGNHWNTLGVAQYRLGNWNEATAPLRKSLELRGENSIDFFFLAMSQWQLGDRDDARKWQTRAVDWMEKNQPQNKELQRFRREAEDLMDKGPEKKPN